MSQSVTTIGKYQILEELGHGGFATVYKAHDPDLGLEVALKVLDSTLMRDRAFVERFRTEARVAARLKHPNIARVYNIDQVEGRLFIAFEFASGGNLRDLLTAQPLLDWPRISTIVQQVGEALDYAHAQQVLHRDVKPGNILLAENGAAVLTDFGLAKAAEGTHVTTTGLTVGTYAYIAPEQAAGKDVDGRADLYALGVVAYELCTGRVPFISDSTPALIHDQVYTPPPPPSQIAARVVTPIELVLLKALTKDREQRYQSGAEFSAALSQAIDMVTGEHVANLYREAKALQQQSDLDGAEDRLQQVLEIKPDHAETQSLLISIGQQRKAQQRYQQLSNQVKQVQAEAAALKQAYPMLNDPDCIFDSFAPATKEIVARPTLLLAPTLGKRTKGLWIAGIVIIIVALGLALLGLRDMQAAITAALARYKWDPQIAVIADQLALGNFMAGLGVGVAAATVIWLVVFYFSTRKKA